MQRNKQEKLGYAMGRSVWRNPIHFITCGFGIGLLPVMPGTFATLFAIVVFFLLNKLPFPIHFALVIGLQFIGVALCGKTNADFKTADHPAAVFDEIAAFQIALLAIPPTWFYVTIGFLLFRLFDIWKPWPIGWVDQHVHGGLGVMLDDILAALATWLILYLTLSLM